MTVQVGIIGVGAMGADHFERLTERVAGALVVPVFLLRRYYRGLREPPARPDIFEE